MQSNSFTPLDSLFTASLDGHKLETCSDGSMQQGNQFNQVTVDWQKAGVSIDTSGLAAFAARAEDIETFRRAGVVLLRGASTE